MSPCASGDSQTLHGAVDTGHLVWELFGSCRCPARGSCACGLFNGLFFFSSLVFFFTQMAESTAPHRGVTGHICGGCATDTDRRILAELLKLVGRISLSRETDTRKEWGRVDARQWNKHIQLYFILIELLHPPALARAKAFLQQSVNSFWILGKRCLSDLFSSLISIAMKIPQ